MSTTVTTALPTGTWSIDPIHSSIGFGVKHLGISTVKTYTARLYGKLGVSDRAAAVARAMRDDLLE